MLQQSTTCAPETTEIKSAKKYKVHLIKNPEIIQIKNTTEKTFQRDSIVHEEIMGYNN